RPDGAHRRRDLGLARAEDSRCRRTPVPLTVACECSQLQEKNMTHSTKKILTLALLTLVAGGGLAQVPEISYRAEDALSGFPNDIHMGEAAGVARNSDGDIYVYTRTGNPTISLGTSRYVSHGGSRIFHFS